ncbi:MAG: HAD-IIA family hydrolase [Promethearchaeota archaeon]|nr:MAG: HAD-IIA family hydrolase [Candidatus Lokiarchaeota archaeon]
MNELIEELRSINLAIFDLDGVVYRGMELIAGVDEIIQKLKDLSIEVVYNSNNSTITRQMYVEKLKNLNIESKIRDFYTSASITAAEITKLKKNSNIFIIGEIGLEKELEAKGHRIIKKRKKFRDVDFVIAGLDRKFDYQKLAIAQKCILEGKAEFYATNSDSTLPSEDGLMPGAGVMINAITTCTNTEPIKIFGKPNPFGINSILEDRQIKPEKACIFGDRLNTDILAGNRAGIKTIVVLTGVATLDQIKLLKAEQRQKNNDKIDMLPDITIQNLDQIFFNEKF